MHLLCEVWLRQEDGVGGNIKGEVIEVLVSSIWLGLG